MVERLWGRCALASITAVVGLLLVACSGPAGVVSVSPGNPAVTARSMVNPAAVACPAAPASATIGSKNVSMVVIDWIDVVQFGGRQYAHGLSAGPATVPAGKVGPVLGRVRCHIADSDAGARYVFRDGDATFLPVGAEVHSILGVPVTVAIAVGHSGTFLYYKVV